MPDEEKSLEDLAGLLVVTPPKGNAEADNASGENEDNSADLTADAANEDGNPDEGTDDAAGEGGGSEGEQNDAEAGAEDEEPFFTVEVDGKQVKVNRAEAQAGYLRTQDYTRKTQEIAETRKAAEAEVAQYRTNREQYAKVLEVLQAKIGPASDEPTTEDWNKLRVEDPDRFAVEWAGYQQRKEQREKVTAEQTRIANEKREEQTTALKTYLGEQRGKLLEALPDWKDPKKAEAGMSRVREYAKTVGFTDKELDQAYDHRMIVAVDKARRYDALMAERKKALKKVDAAPEMPAPGNRTPKVESKKATRAAAHAQLKKTGRDEDAIALLDA